MALSTFMTTRVIAELKTAIRAKIPNISNSALNALLVDRTRLNYRLRVSELKSILEVFRDNSDLSKYRQTLSSACMKNVRNFKYCRKLELVDAIVHFALGKSPKYSVESPSLSNNLEKLSLDNIEPSQQFAIKYGFTNIKYSPIASPFHIIDIRPGKTFNHSTIISIPFFTVLQLDSPITRDMRQSLGLKTITREQSQFINQKLSSHGPAEEKDIFIPPTDIRIITHAIPWATDSQKITTSARKKHFESGWKEELRKFHASVSSDPSRTDFLDEADLEKKLQSSEFSEECLSKWKREAKRIWQLNSDSMLKDISNSSPTLVYDLILGEGSAEDVFIRAYIALKKRKEFFSRNKLITVDLSARLPPLPEPRRVSLMSLEAVVRERMLCQVNGSMELQIKNISCQYMDKIISSSGETSSLSSGTTIRTTERISCPPPATHKSVSFPSNTIVTDFTDQFIKLLYPRVSQWLVQIKKKIYQNRMLSILESMSPEEKKEFNKLSLEKRRSQIWDRIHELGPNSLFEIVKACQGITTNVTININLSLPFFSNYDLQYEEKKHFGPDAVNHIQYAKNRNFGAVFRFAIKNDIPKICRIVMNKSGVHSSISDKLLMKKSPEKKEEEVEEEEEVEVQSVNNSQSLIIEQPAENNVGDPINPKAPVITDSSSTIVHQDESTASVDNEGTKGEEHEQRESEEKRGEEKRGEEGERKGVSYVQSQSTKTEEHEPGAIPHRFNSWIDSFVKSIPSLVFLQHNDDDRHDADTTISPDSKPFNNDAELRLRFIEQIKASISTKLSSKPPPPPPVTQPPPPKSVPPPKFVPPAHSPDIGSSSQRVNNESVGIGTTSKREYVPASQLYRQNSTVPTSGGQTVGTRTMTTTSGVLQHDKSDKTSTVAPVGSVRSRFVQVARDDRFQKQSTSASVTSKPVRFYVNALPSFPSWKYDYYLKDDEKHLSLLGKKQPSLKKREKSILEKLSNQSLPLLSYQKKKKDEKDEEDSDLEECMVSLPITCPLLRGMCKIPARSEHCQHKTCFDLESFLFLSLYSKKYQCPCCLKSIALDDLIVDTDFLSVLLDPRVQQRKIDDIPVRELTEDEKNEILILYDSFIGKNQTEIGNGDIRVLPKLSLFEMVKLEYYLPKYIIDVPKLEQALASVTSAGSSEEDLNGESDDSESSSDDSWANALEEDQRARGGESNASGAGGSSLGTIGKRRISEAGNGKDDNEKKRNEAEKEAERRFEQIRRDIFRREVLEEEGEEPPYWYRARRLPDEYSDDDYDDSLFEGAIDHRHRHLPYMTRLIEQAAARASRDRRLPFLAQAPPRYHIGPISNATSVAPMEEDDDVEIISIENDFPVVPQRPPITHSSSGALENPLESVGQADEVFSLPSAVSNPQSETPNRNSNSSFAPPGTGTIDDPWEID
ncbi:hypothetical protein ADUPG1_007849 [Aduncisulcus paluster]|uniref:SP-RING-type domain-containing protein n=1 Tax=Aduncisulcus paluster TaxID=2918883 RepID=A0ABQ5KPR8_9EUKA|nr:hypothetical protein ADUPG1_007849 [Aduncisulcus paluster]